MQKQAMEKRSELLFAENRRLIEEKDVRLSSMKERAILCFLINLERNGTQSTNDLG